MAKAESIYGQYGGKVLREFNGAGQKFVPGAILTPEMVEEWPVSNRIALANVGKVVWFHSLSEDEAQARTSSPKRSSKAKEASSKTKKTEETPKKKSNRTK